MLKSKSLDFSKTHVVTEMNVAPDTPPEQHLFASDKDDKIAMMMLALDWIDEAVAVAQQCEHRLLHSLPTGRADYPDMLREARAAAGVA